MALFSNLLNVESPVKDLLGDHLYHLDGRGANLFVYEKCIVIDRTQGGLFNLETELIKSFQLKIS